MSAELLANRLADVLENLHQHTQCGGIYYPFAPRQGPILGRGVCRFCSSCVHHGTTGPFCRHHACTAAVQGHSIGDIWYFRCWLGIDSLAIAIAPQGELLGAIEVGGFFSPGGTEEAQQNILARLNTLAPDSLAQLAIGALQGMREMDFKQIKGVADFLAEATFSAGLNAPAHVALRQRIHRQRERLAARLQEARNNQLAPQAALLNTLAPLLAAIRAGKRLHILAELDNFLGQLLLAADSRAERAKAGIMLLAAAIFRDDIDAGEPWRAAMHKFEERIIDLEKLDSIEDACIWVEDLVTAAASRSDKDEPILSDRLIAWLGEHYRHQPTLAEAARALAASPSSITHKLRRETAKTFTQHLAAIRISEAKRLLAYSSLSLAEISAHCGFVDQSYFTKVFRRTVNLTPGEFRRLLD